MKVALIISIIINMGLIIKLIVMRLSLKELSEDYRERVTLDSDTLIGVSSRDKYIRELFDLEENEKEGRNIIISKDEIQVFLNEPKVLKCYANAVLK